MKRIAVFLCLSVLLFSLIGIVGPVRASSGVTFTATELLGCPTDTSVTVNVVPSSGGQIYFQYSTASGIYSGPGSGQTNPATLASGTPFEVVMSGLTPDTKYYYRIESSLDGNSWTPGTEHSFHTQRSPGDTFTFTVTADSHAQFNTALQNAMTDILSDRPDFNIDLGDTFSTDGATSQSTVNNECLAYRNPLYFGKIGSSVPLFLASGNHENEEGWNLDDTPFSIAVGSIQARKAYYPTPIQDRFYSANTDPLTTIDASVYGDQYREDYYAWTWGNALFVVIDPFQYTMNLPYAPGTAGEGTDDPQTGDQWSWTLGAQQYQWLKTTLQNSNAKYKFIFDHQPLGGIPNLTVAGAGPGYVRGGAQAAAYFEWGGENADGTAGFAAHRNQADFGSEPIQQLMLHYGVSAYFHGHDHQFVYETRDGIVYQEVPTPSIAGSGFSGIYTQGNHATYNTIKILPDSGYLRISVAPDKATVAYISSGNYSSNGTVNYTYTIAPNSTTNSTLSSIAVTPNPATSLKVGSTEQFTATGTYSDNSTANITSSATWASSDNTKATILAGGLATGVAVGTTNITAALGSVTSPAVSLTVISATTSSPPTVTGISPSSGSTAGGTSVTITGTGFTGATAVNFGKTAATGFIVKSDTSITSSSPASSACTVDVTVTTGGGTSATSSADQFTYQAPQAVTYIGDIGSAAAVDTHTYLKVTTTAAVAAGDDIIIAAAWGPNLQSPLTVTDTAGNTYTQEARAVNAGNVLSYIIAAFNVKPLPSGSTITITSTYSQSVAKAAVVSVFRGLAATSALDQTKTGTGSGTSPSSGSVTTTQTDELLIGAIGTSGTTSDNAGTWQNSFIAGRRVGTSGATANKTISMAYRIVSSTGTYTASKTGITSTTWAVSMATFKAAS